MVSLALVVSSAALHAIINERFDGNLREKSGKFHQDTIVASRNGSPGGGRPRTV